MSNTLTDFFISDTYQGLLHSNGAALPVSGQVTISDGAGSASAISLGRAGVGMTVTGTTTVANLSGTGTTKLANLTVGNIIYPTVAGAVGSFVTQGGGNTLTFSSTIPSTSLGDLPGGIPAGTLYKNIESIRVNDQGLVTDVTTFIDTTDEVTITATKYIKANNIGTYTVQGDARSIWTQISLPDEYQGAKAGIFMISPLSLEWTDQFKCVIYASHNGGSSGSYPIVSFDGDSDDETSIGVQFCGRISSDRRIWLSRDILGSNINPQQYVFTCIAAQF